MMKRALSIFLTGVFLLGLLPTSVLAAEADSGVLCPHHQEHSYEVCGYVEAAEEAPCNMGCSETVEDNQIIHVEGCTYTPAVEGHPCGYVCPICPVQALIDALPAPEDITADSRAGAEAQVAAIDTARAELTDEELEQLDTARYQPAVSALAALDGQAGNDLPMPAAEGDVSYLYCDETGQNWDTGTKHIDEYIVVTAADATNGWGGSDVDKEYWYVVNSDVDVEFTQRVTVTGDVHLILTDGCNLTIDGGINAEGSNSLTIYGQQNGTGVLTAQNPGYANAGIGVGQDGKGGAVTINGGTVNATGGEYGAGIGGDWDGLGYTVTINGGTVNATGGYYGGGLNGGGGGNITINGGNVTATGDTRRAGIQCGTGQTLTINGGRVIATGGSYSAGIGGGNNRDGGDITINGGNVTAYGYTGIGGGYGGASGAITITGGIVNASCGNGSAIGGDDDGDGGSILITGGTVIADGKSQGRGIGGKNINITISGGDITATAGSGSDDAAIGGRNPTITISGGTVNATSKNKGAAIGGDQQWAGGIITISGGNVTATAEGKSAAGIGGGGGAGGTGWRGGNGGTITISGGTVTVTGGKDAPDIGGGKGYTNESTGAGEIAPTDKIEIGEGATVKNGSGGEPNYGPTHGEDTSKWDSDDSQHWHPCGISGCPDTSHQSKKEAHSFGDWVTDEYDHWKECEICNRKTDETSHTYNQETVKPEALKSAADCANPAIYYKSCVCGKVSTNDSETFTSGSALTHNMTHHAAVAATCTQTGNKEYWSCSLCNKNFSDSGGTTEINDVTTPRVSHNWSNIWSNDGDSHWHECTVCEEKNDLAAHIGDAEVCNAPQTCTVCGYQMTDALNHNWDGWVSNGNGTHTRTCQRDPSHTETGDCSGGTATCSAQAICSVCGKPYGSTDSGNHTGGTEIRDKKEATTSSEGYTGDTYCLGCGEKIAVGTTIPKLNGGGGGGTHTPPTTPTYPPTVERPSGGGGTPSTSPSNPKQGDTVTVTPKPDSGYEVDTITVIDRNGKPVEVTKKPDGTYTFTQPTGKVKIEVTYKPTQPIDRPWNNPFADVSEGDWYYEAVRFVQEQGLMNGYSDGRFGPNDTLSRAQLAQILFNKEGRPAVSGGGFNDVDSGAWYADAVTWAAENGIVGGYGNGTFGPNDPITREQLAVMLWRYSGSPAATNKELHFNDTDEISPFALEALRWAVENGILNGYGDGRLGPQGQATRAQVAQMLKNFFEKG